MKFSSNISCTIHSGHPLAFCTIKQALSADSELRNLVKTYSSNSKPLSRENANILIIDICSVGQWPDLLQRWQSEGGSTIALLSQDGQNRGEDLKLLYMGVMGIVALTDELATHLPKAVRAVAEGKLWVRRDALARYVKETNVLLGRLSSHSELFTEREQQIIGFLRQGFSNRQIASSTGISERTAKFHVSNILRKYQIDNRKKLRVANASITSRLPEVPDQQSRPFENRVGQ